MYHQGQLARNIESHKELVEICIQKGVSDSRFFCDVKFKSALNLSSALK